MSTANNSSLSRRDLLRGVTVASGSLLVALNTPRPLAIAAMSNEKPVVFNRRQWLVVEAITGRIIPTDHQPGAIEANCVNFIDKALANEDAEALPDVTAGLNALEIVTDKLSGKAFNELAPELQDRILQSLEQDTADPWPDDGPAASAFFETVRALTIMGFMADPKYGGNADMSGWKVARYPGPSHHSGGYTPAQMLGEEPIKTLWGDTQ